MTINYKQLEDLVREAMFTGGGINEPSAPEGVPHRMPAADGGDKQQDMGDPEANEKYEVALKAREATEQLVEALDQPIFDGAYEFAFKASACLRRCLNSIEEAGAHPMPMQRVVAPPKFQQKYTNGSPGQVDGMGMIGFGGDGGLEEEAGADVKLSGKMATKGQQAKQTLDRAKGIAKGDTLGDVDNRERGILQTIEKTLTDVAEADDLNTYRTQLENTLKMILKMSKRKQARGNTK